MRHPFVFVGWDSTAFSEFMEYLCLAIQYMQKNNISNYPYTIPFTLT